MFFNSVPTEDVSINPFILMDADASSVVMNSVAENVLVREARASLEGFK